MKKNHNLKIYSFSHLLINSEFTSLLGDKFFGAIPYVVEMTGDIEEANIVVWDGIVTTKNKIYATQVIEKIREGRVLLWMRDNANKEASTEEVEELNKVELSSWSALPEEILAALSECHKKLANV